MAAHANSIPAPGANPPDKLTTLIDAMIPLASEIMGHGSDAQKDRIHDVISHIADMAIGSDVLIENVRAKARAMRLIYAGHELGFEDGFREDCLDGGSRAEQLALQVLVLMSVPQ